MYVTRHTSHISLDFIMPHMTQYQNSLIGYIVSGIPIDANRVPVSIATFSPVSYIM